jgi:hypothetical protein
VKGNALIAFAGAVVITGATACGAPSAPRQTASASPSAATTLVSTSAPAAGAQSACVDLSGTVDPERICHTHIATANYEIDFTFPADYPDQRALTDYLTQRRDGFIGFVSERPKREFPYALDAKATAYRSATPTSNTESIVFTEYDDTGGAHPVTGYEAFTYDLDKGTAVTFDTLFKPDAQPVEVLDPIVRRELEPLSDDYGPVSDNILGAKMYQNFALTDDAVIFFIGQGQWLPQVAGPREISVPRTKLASLLG